MPHDPQRAMLAGQLRAVHTLKAAALHMFDPMLAAVDAERSNPQMAQVHDLLENMLGAFGEHRAQTAGHEQLLARRLGELGEPLTRPCLRGLVAAGAATPGTAR